MGNRFADSFIAFGHVLTYAFMGKKHRRVDTRP